MRTFGKGISIDLRTDFECDFGQPQKYTFLNSMKLEFYWNCQSDIPFLSGISSGFRHHLTFYNLLILLHKQRNRLQPLNRIDVINFLAMFPQRFFKRQSFTLHDSLDVINLPTHRQSLCGHLLGQSKKVNALHIAAKENLGFVLHIIRIVLVSVYADFEDAIIIGAVLRESSFLNE